MKRRNVLLSSIITIILCLSVIAGSTFALFTDEDSFNIAVNSGEVDVAASIVDLERYSAAKVAGTTNAAEMIDENGKAYAYRDAAGNYYELNFGLNY